MINVSAQFEVLKAKLACHMAGCLLPVEIVERCGLSYRSSYCEAIFIALLIINKIQCYTGICATGLYVIAYFTRQHNH